MIYICRFVSDVELEYFSTLRDNIKPFILSFETDYRFMKILFICIHQVDYITQIIQNLHINFSVLFVSVKFVLFSQYTCIMPITDNMLRRPTPNNKHALEQLYCLFYSMKMFVNTHMKRQLSTHILPFSSTPYALFVSIPPLQTSFSLSVHLYVSLSVILSLHVVLFDIVHWYVERLQRGIISPSHISTFVTFYSSVWLLSRLSTAWFPAWWLRPLERKSL